MAGAGGPATGTSHGPGEDSGGESQETVPSDEASPSGTCCRIP